MSKLKDVVTFQICENLIDDGIAFIWFFYKEEYENWQGIGKICETLSKALLGFEYAKIAVEWQSGTASCPKGYFKFETDTANDIAAAIKKILKN